MQSGKNVANYLQRTLASKGYLVAKMVRTGKGQMISLPRAVDVNLVDTADLKIIRDEEVRAIAKRRSKLADLLKKGYVTVYDQCLQEVKDKLEAMDNWKRIQREQLLDELIMKIKRICIGFNDHKQEVFNLVQALKTLFLYTQTDRETMEEYGWNFRSFWDTVEVFGGLPGVHEGLVAGILKEPGHVSGTSATPTKIKNVEEEASNSVKAALLIRGRTRGGMGGSRTSWQTTTSWGQISTPTSLTRQCTSLGTIKCQNQVGARGGPEQMQAEWHSSSKAAKAAKEAEAAAAAGEPDKERQAHQELTQAGEMPQ